MGNRLPDREARAKEFFFDAVQRLPEHTFLLGGSGWESEVGRFANLKYAGHVYTRDHNAFNVSPLAVLNVNRDSMAKTGYSPPTRVFEAAGAGGCLIMDEWEGAELFLEPGREVLLASNGEDVVEHLRTLTPERARSIGQAARERTLRENTYQQRALQVEALFVERLGR